MCSAESLLAGVDLRHELAASEESGFPTTGMETARSGAGVTLDYCSTGYWRNVMLYSDSNSEVAIAYPTYYVSASGATTLRMHE